MSEQIQDDCPECRAKPGKWHEDGCGLWRNRPIRKGEHARVPERDPNISLAEPAEGNLNTDERGTCARFNGGKVRLTLVPLHLLMGAARVFIHGTKKYAPWNWAKGGPWSTPMDCLLRHLIKWWFFGEEYDRDSGLHHLDHAMCNLLFLLHYKDTYREGDDRPNQEATRFVESLENFCQLWYSEEEPHSA